jgi:hypothetical protein
MPYDPRVIARLIWFVIVTGWLLFTAFMLHLLRKVNKNKARKRRVSMGFAEGVAVGSVLLTQEEVDAESRQRYGGSLVRFAHRGHHHMHHHHR